MLYLNHIAAYKNALLGMKNSLNDNHDSIPKFACEPGLTNRWIAVKVWAASRWVDLIDEIDSRSSSPEMDPELAHVAGNS